MSIDEQGFVGALRRPGIATPRDPIKGPTGGYDGGGRLAWLTAADRLIHQLESNRSEPFHR